ncbi:MAG: TetR/AcrR family transcriptional regulator [Nitratireductor sp.]|uniref:TetR/AcrR family transcriptional regulator n=1 Tax=Thalassobaculum sp. TaxID=2022740 RepID=UPI0032EB8480
MTTAVENLELVERRRGQIVAAATELFAERGFYRTTIKEIAAKAGVSAGLVYLYFREKEDVLLLVLLQVLEAYACEIPKAIEGIDDPLERLLAAFDSYCRVVDTHRAPTVLAYRSTKSLPSGRREMVQKRETETNEIFSSAISECIKAGIVREVNVDILTYQVVLAAHGWALKGWYWKSRMSLDKYVAESIDTLISGALTDEGRRRFDTYREATLTAARVL